jgi:hypothetical protein
VLGRITDCSVWQRSIFAAKSRLKEFTTMAETRKLPNLRGIAQDRLKETQMRLFQKNANTPGESVPFDLSWQEG